MLFHPDDVEGVTHNRALSIFKACPDDQGGTYLVEVKTLKRFQLAVKLVALGDSFRSVSRQLGVIREETGMAEFGGASDVTISNYVRIVCAASLQSLSEIWAKSWAVSISFDCSTHQTRSYVDIRIRVFLNGDLQNLHLIALPMFDRHTGEIITALLERLFDALFKDWKTSLIGLTTDGDRTMTGRVRGVVTRLERQLGRGVVRVWCGLHQLDLVMQRFFESAFDEHFLSLLTQLIGYLRRQQNFVSDMRSECPKFCSVRWLSMGKVLTWLLLHRVEVQEYLQKKEVSWAPSDPWWVFVCAMHALVCEANAVFVELQGLKTLVSEQRERLQGLVTTYCTMSQMEGPLGENRLLEKDPSTHSIEGSFVVSHSHARSCLDGLGRWVLRALDGMNEASRVLITRSLADVLVKLADGVSKIVAERDSSNDVGELLPPVLPHQLVKSDMRTLVSNIEVHEQRLLRLFSETQVQQIDEEFAALLRAYRMEPPLKTTLDGMTGKSVSFQEAWAPVAGRFEMLKEFCGGIATVFPNSTTVEADFSRLGLEKTEYRKSLTDLSLEGVLHSKQFNVLVSI